MSADLFDPILGLIQQATGNNNNSWGTTFNASFAGLCSRSIAGAITRNNTGGSLDLSGSPPPNGPRQDIDAIQIFNGALVSDLTVTVPNISKIWWFQNNTTGAFNLYVKTPGGTATQIPQSVGRIVMCDGNNNVIRSDKDEIGVIRHSGKAATGPGELLCNGASLLRTAYPDLFTAIGTLWGSVDGTHFTLPNFIDTGRFLRSAGGGFVQGTYLANQNLAHTHAGSTFSGTTSGQSSGHTHTGSATTGTESALHTHTYNTNSGLTVGGGGAFGAVATPSSPQTSSQSAFHTHSFSLTTSDVSGDHTHTYSGTVTVTSSGGSEARPECAVVLIHIKY